MTGVLIPGLVQAQRLVIKIGSALVVDQDQAAPRAAWLSGVAKDIAALRARGVDVIVVSSGAIALARRTLRLTRKKLRLEEKQAAAAVGQIRLAQAWTQALSEQGLTAAQLLLTLGDTEEQCIVGDRGPSRQRWWVGWARRARRWVEVHDSRCRSSTGHRRVLRRP